MDRLLGFGLGSLVFTSPLWPKVAAASREKNCIETTELGILVSLGAVILGSLGYFEPRT